MRSLREIPLRFQLHSGTGNRTRLQFFPLATDFSRRGLTLRCDFNPCVTIAIFALAVSGGPKGSSVSYQVQIDPEASPAGANWIHVQPDLRYTFQRGDIVCVHVGRAFSQSLGTPSAAARNGASSINRGPLMSAWGQKRTFRDFRMTSTLPPKADINWRSLEFPLCASRANSPPARLRL